MKPGVSPPVAADALGVPWLSIGAYRSGARQTRLYRAAGLLATKRRLERFWPSGAGWHDLDADKDPAGVGGLMPALGARTAQAQHD